MGSNNKLRIAYEKYDTNSPFELSRKLGVTLEYFDLPKNIYGYYTPMKHAHHIIISQSISADLQEKACIYLVSQYLLDEASHFCLDRETFNELENTPKISSSRIGLKNLLYHYTSL